MNSLSVRIALVLSSVLLVLMVVAGTWVERKLTRAISNEEVDQAKIHAQTLLASLQILMINGQGTLARDWLDSMRGTAGIVGIDVLRRDGREAFSDLNTVNSVNEYINAPIFSRQSELPIHPTVFSVSPEAFSQALAGKVIVESSFLHEITVLQPIRSGEACLSCHGYDENPLRGVLRLSLSRDKTLVRIQDMRTSLWAVAIGLVLLLAVAVWVAMRISVLRPINDLRDAISRVGSGDRNVKLLAKGQGELDQLASVFDVMQRDLLATETRIRAVTDNVSDAIITTTDLGAIDSINHAVEQMFGYVASDLLGKNISVLMYDPDQSERNVLDVLTVERDRLINDRVEVVGKRKDGAVFPVEIALSEMVIDEQRYIVAIVRDITERQRQNAALQHQALHDALTELPNRSLLSDRIRQGILLAQRDQQTMALLVMDLDRFKDINDTLGHQYGDRVLQEVAQRMRDVLRESDTIARLGGDEFAVLLPRTTIEQAQQIAEKLLATIDRPFHIEAQLLHIGVSVGIAMFPKHGDDEVTLLQRADVAMYVAKRNHTGFNLYDPSADQHSLRNLALLGELRLAIELNQLVLYFQPKVDVKSGRVYGVESLVRWQHPAHGLMSPDEFVPLAEQTGLIGALSEWVLTEGLRQCVENQPEGLDMHVAINLSVRNIQDSKFPGRVQELIGEICDSPEHVRLEITETAIMEDPEHALEALNMLSNMGVKLSIDDFGTGYSSLAHLKQMPVDELKIDKSFVEDMISDENDAVIVRSIIDLAHNIGIKVVAEGVEDQATYDMLKALGCDSVQGYFISKPLPIEALMVWMRDSPWALGGR